MKAQKSIILITVDCLRADHVGFMGYSRPTTPFMDSLAAESFVFPEAIVAGAPTYYSFPAIMASRYPLALGRDCVGLAPNEPCLASVLKQAGYATGAFSAANPYLATRFGYDEGFDVFRDFWDEPPSAPAYTKPTGGATWKTNLNNSLKSLSSYLGPLGAMYDELYFQYCQLRNTANCSYDTLRCFPAADAIVDHALEWLATAQPGPFFLWLHLMDPHAPFYPNEESLKLMGGAQTTPLRARYLNSFWYRSDIGPRRLASHRDEIIGLYDAGIRWVDVQMARLVDVLRLRNLWDECVFAFTADHGEEFLEHGGRLHPPTRLTEELIHVPLLVRAPQAAHQKPGDSPFSLLHLAPTLLDAAGVKSPAEFRGRSYWEQMQKGGDYGEVAIAESISGCLNPYSFENRLGPRALAVRESRFKLLVQFDPPADVLYDLELDPGEQRPLPRDAERHVRQRLLHRAHEHLQRTIQQRDDGLRLQARLRELRLEWSKPASERFEAKVSPFAS